MLDFDCSSSPKPVPAPAPIVRNYAHNKNSSLRTRWSLLNEGIKRV